MCLAPRSTIVHTILPLSLGVGASGTERIRSPRAGMPPSTRSHPPPRGTRYSVKAQGTPVARSGSAESMSWKCRWGAVEYRCGPPGRSPPRPEPPGQFSPTPSPESGTRRPRRLRPPAGSRGCRRPAGIRCGPDRPDGVLHRERGLAHQVDPRALRHPVHGRHHLAVEGGTDGLASAVVVACAPAEQEDAQAAGRVEVEALGWSGRTKSNA